MRLIFDTYATDGKIQGFEVPDVLEKLGLCWMSEEFDREAAAVLGADVCRYEDLVRIVAVELAQRSSQPVAFLAHCRAKYRR